MTEVAEVLYITKDRAPGRWDHAAARRRDGQPDLKRSAPVSQTVSTSPERLFAAGWSVRVEDEICLAALKLKVVFSDDAAIDADVDLCFAHGAYFLQARLDVSLSDLPPEIAQGIAAMARLGSPYSKTLRGKIDLVINEG